MFIERLVKIEISKFMAKSSIWLILVFCCLVSASRAQDDEVVVDKIIAKVDNYIVLKSELEQAYIQFLSRGQLAGGNTRCEILESLLISKLLLAKAEIDSVIVSEEEVSGDLDRRIRTILAQLPDPSQVEEIYGKTIGEITDELRPEVRDQLTIQRMQGTITADVNVTPAEVRRFFNKIPKDSLPYFSLEVSVSQIVKNPEIGKPQKDQARSFLRELKRRIEQGEGTFEDYATRYSADPGSARNGGGLGFQKRGALVPEYEATAFKLKPGEISDPVESEFGFHMIQLIERRGNEYDSRHILVKPNSVEEDILRAESYLDSLRGLVMDEDYEFAKLAREYSDDKFTGGSGGFFLGQDGSDFISVENIDPVLYLTLDTMDVGTISKPVRFKQPDGTDAVRILFYKAKKKPHQASFQKDYQKIRQAAQREKQDRILAKWFRKSKDEVYIEIDPDYDQCTFLNQ